MSRDILFPLNCIPEGKVNFGISINENLKDLFHALSSFGGVYSDTDTIYFPSTDWKGYIVLSGQIEIDRGVWQGDLYEIEAGYAEFDFGDEVLTICPDRLRQCAQIGHEGTYFELQSIRVVAEVDENAW